jgi:hypothetical protein
MKNILLFFLLITVSGCTSKINEKQVLLDSLRQQYAGKQVHLTFTNNEAQTESLIGKYAYIDKNKSEPAFELNAEQVYKLAFEESIPFVPTTNRPDREETDMLLIEIPNTTKRGFVSYRNIREFQEVSTYDN